MNNMRAQGVARIGGIIQKIHNLDHTKISLKSAHNALVLPGDDTYFYSDKSPVVDLETDECCFSKNEQ